MKNDESDKVRKTLYLDEPLVTKIKKLAEKDSRSFNAYVELFLQEQFQ
jgi:hypothetical protein